MICDNKKFWKHVKPVFTENPPVSESITLIENGNIIGNDYEVSEIFNTFFSQTVKNLRIKPWDNLENDSSCTDPITTIIKRYENHPSVLMIRQRMPKDRSFSFQEVKLNDVLKELSKLDKSKANPSESIPTKIVL